MHAALYVAGDTVSLSLCHGRGSHLYIGLDKKLLENRTSKACNLVKPGSFL